MAWERRGTIQVTNGSVNVVGTGTFFNSVTAGSGITIDGYIYAVETITDNTHITLSRAFVGTSGSGKSYEIFPTQSYAADVYAEVVDLLNTFGPFRGSVEDLNALILAKAAEAAASATAAATSAASALADKNTTATLKSDVITLKADVTTLKSDVTTLKDTATTQAGIATTKASEAASSAASALSDKNATATLKSDVTTLKADVVTLKGDVTTLKDTATTQAGIATTKATEAASSAASALSDKNATATLKGDVITLKSDVTALKDTATSQAGIATTKASEAASSASAAATSATNAATSKTNADAARDAALAAKTAAEAARDAALTAYDNFDDRMLGNKTSDPTTDNDGNALVAGTLYFNTTANEMRLYTGSAWVAAYVSGSSFLSLSGGTLTGPLTLNSDPSTALQAATKQYADTKLALSGGTLTGNVVVQTSSGPTVTLNSSHATSKRGSVKFAQSGTVQFEVGTDAGLSGNRDFFIYDAVAGQQRLTISSTGAVNVPGSLSASNLSGTNTGDQTITLTGDVTGSGTGSFAATLANSGVAAGTYPKVTVDAKGRVTSGSNLSLSDVTTGLGYTPLQQGGGANQGNNKLYVGWHTAGDGLRLQIDTTDYGKTWPINVSGTAANITGTYTGSITSGQIQGGLGFFPIQQGGGTGQGTNKLYIGWLGSNLGLQVDSSNYGANWPINVNGTASAITGTYSGSLTSGQVTSALGFTPARYDSAVQGGKIAISNSVASNDVFNGGIELREVGSVGTGQTHYSYAPGLTFHWSGTAAAQLYMNASGEFVFGAQTDKANLRGIRAGTVYSNGAACVTTSSGNAPTATLASKASTLAQNGGNGAAMTFNWSGQGGQPSWLWGGNDGANHYVYNPSNFNVNSATYASWLRPPQQTGTNQADLVYSQIADNDFFRIRVGGDATNSGWVELATADDGNEPIYVRQYANAFTGSPARTAALLDSNGNTTFPQSVYSVNQYCSGVVSGTGGVYSNNWFRAYSATGYYNETYGRGLTVPDGTTSYGNVMCYGSGLGGWSGIAISSNNKTNFMTDGNTWGMYNQPSGVWMMNCDMSGNVQFAGNVTAYSDLRLKDNVREIDNVEARRDTLANSAIKYERDGRTRIGYGAQLLRDNGCPEFVQEADDARKLATGTGTLSVDYGETTAVLAVASKRTDDRVAALEAQVAALLQTVADLQNQLKGE